MKPPATQAPSRRSRLDRWLHWLYFHGSGVQHFFASRIRPPGLALGLVLILAACLCVGQGRTSVYQLFSLSLGLAVIGMPWAMIRRARVEVRRELPKFGTAGEPLTYTVGVTNRGKLALRRAWLADRSPDPRPTADDFVTLREPGEEERNPYDRLFAFFRWQWLIHGKRLYEGGKSRDSLSLQPGSTARVAIDLTPQRRGVIVFKDLRILLPDPFGLFQRCARLKSAPATLVVLPRRYPLPPLELPGGAAFKISGGTNTNTIGNSGEFVGLRDYRPGDPLRQIHWRSWARTGRPIVKELEDTHYPRYGLVVDTLSRERTDQRFEDAISVAASFAASLDTSESLLDLMFIKNEAHRVTAGRGVERAEKLLEVLAGVEPSRQEHWDSLSRLVLRHRDDLSSCIVILNGWDAERAELLQTLMRGGVACVPVIIGSGPAPAGVPGHWLESGYIARDLQRLPRHLSN